jgi:hypothetical protein
MASASNNAKSHFMRTTILYPRTSYLEGRAPRARGRRRVDVCGIAEPFHRLRDLSLSKRFRPPITENEIFAAQRFCSNTPPSRGRMHSAPRLKYGTRRSVSVPPACIGKVPLRRHPTFLSKSLPRNWPGVHSHRARHETHSLWRGCGAKRAAGVNLLHHPPGRDSFPGKSCARGAKSVLLARLSK